MNKKKIIIAIILFVICALIISIPIITSAERNYKWTDVELSDEVKNTMISSPQAVGNEAVTGLPLVTNENPYGTDNLIASQTEQLFMNEQNENSEPTEADKEQYARWKQENEEFGRKIDILNNLLNKYYPDEKKEIDEMPNPVAEGTTGISLVLTEKDIKKTELIVKLYNDQKLSREEKQICKERLEYYYNEQTNSVKFSDDLKSEVEKIIK